jgi:autophagy-related protein 18
MLYKTNLVLLVGLTDFGEFSPKKVTIWTTSKNTVLCASFPFSSNIINVKINKIRMIICEENYLHIYSIDDMKVLHSIKKSDLSLDEIVLSRNNLKNVWLCHSTSKDEGIVRVIDTLKPTSKEAQIQIKAHKSPILKMCLSYEGDKLATCSYKGTKIKIFSLPKGDLLYMFKKHFTSSFIFCLNFSRDNEKLISISDIGMMSLYDFREELENLEKNKEAKRFVEPVGVELNKSENENDFEIREASISYNDENLKKRNLVGFNNDKDNEAFCFTSDGSFSLFNINYQEKSIKKVFEKNIEG